MSSLPVADGSVRVRDEVKRAAIRVLGLDPAAAGPTGYGVVETDGRHYKMLDYGAFRVDTKRQKEFAGAALHDIHSLLCELIQKFEPTVMAVESIFSALNVRTALRLAEVRGVVLLAAAQNGVVVHSYSPREVKASVAGYGHADKRQIQLMVRALLSLHEMPEPADAADALAVALCHIQTDQARVRFGIPEAAPTASAQLRAGQSRDDRVRVAHGTRRVGRETPVRAAGI